MGKAVEISGFADEISSDLEEQLQTVVGLGMRYISLRSANGKGIADYTLQEAERQLLPLLKKYQVKVSSIGSPIGKIEIGNEEGYEKQKRQLEELCGICHLLDCRYIRMFSFFIPQGEKADDHGEEVIRKLQGFLEIAKVHDIVLLHENEKEIYGDTKERCLHLFESIKDEHFRAAFDFANFVQCGEDTRECWKALWPYVEYIHIKDAVSTDNENVVCGTGEGHIEELLDLAINQEGYQGFLTLEPHLVLFDSLASLETAAAENVIKKNKAKDGAEGYAMQYHALCDILKNIHVMEG